ncbi:MAG: hypothetical protein WCK05_10710 [Planctomycetota bacterium]
MIERVCETEAAKKASASAEWPEPPVCSLSPDAALVEIMAKRFREELDRRGAGDWRIFCGGEEVLDTDVILKEPESFEEKALKWEPLSLTGHMLQPGHLWFTYDEGREVARERPMGFLSLGPAETKDGMMGIQPRNGDEDQPPQRPASMSAACRISP